MKMPICHMLIVTPLILANFITPAGISLFGTSVTLHNPKREILFLSKIEFLGCTNFPKRKFYADHLILAGIIGVAMATGSPKTNALLLLFPNISLKKLFISLVIFLISLLIILLKS